MRLILIGVGFALLPGSAWAFNFGFVRAPGWMDPYFVVALGVAFVFMALTAVFKPRDVPFSEMYYRKHEFSRFGRLIYQCFGVAFIILIAMLFIGMGLQRAAEAGVL